MDKIIKIIIVAILLTGVVSSCSYLERHDEKKRIYIVKSNTLNVRQSGNTKSSIIGKVYKNDTLNKVKAYIHWIAIEFNGDTGYVSTKYVESIRVFDSSRVANMKLDPVSTIIRDSMNNYLNWRKWEFWVGMVVMYLISRGLLAICRNLDDILDDWGYEEYSSLPYYSGIFGSLLSFVLMFWREEVMQNIFLNKLMWLPHDNNWISWYIWSLAVLLLLFSTISFLSNLITYGWKGVFRTLYYYLTSIITFITGLFIGVFIVVFAIGYILISIVTGLTTISESELISKATYDGLGSLNLSEWQALGRIFRRHGLSEAADSIDDAFH